jgi:hypothetical protein
MTLPCSRCRRAPCRDGWLLCQRCLMKAARTGSIRAWRVRKRMQIARNERTEALVLTGAIEALIFARDILDVAYHGQQS